MQGFLFGSFKTIQAKLLRLFLEYQGFTSYWTPKKGSKAKAKNLKQQAKDTLFWRKNGAKPESLIIRNLYRVLELLSIIYKKTNYTSRVIH